MPSIPDNMFISAERVSQLYMTIFAQEFSPCGKYLAIANSYGDIAVHQLDSVLKFRSRKTKLDDDKIKGETANKFQAHEDPIFSLTSNDKFLISGSIAQIKGWRWTDISSADPFSSKHNAPSWVLNVPVNKAVGSRPEINFMIVKGDILYAAAGDGNVYGWSLETSKKFKWPKSVSLRKMDSCNTCKIAIHMAIRFLSTPCSFSQPPSSVSMKVTATTFIA